MRHRWLLLVLAAWAATSVARADDEDYVYLARPQDTLIGMSARLLIEPGRWPQLQQRNSIANPRRIPVGSPIRIPTSWLRTTPVPAAVVALAGSAVADGRPLAIGDSVAEGVLIATADQASLTLRLADGSTVTLPQQSSLRLERMRRVDGAGTFDLLLQLQSGSAESRATPKREGGRFEVRTPFAVSAVRGTEFRTRFDPGAERSTAETIEGRTALRTTGGGVDLPAGYGSSVAGDAPPSPPVELLPAPRLPGVSFAYERAPVAIACEPVPGAASYAAQLATDESFHDIVAQWRGTEPRVEFPEVDDGHYLLRVRAIDHIGLEGHDSVAPVVVNARPMPPQLTWQARADTSGARLAWKASEGSVAHRVQVARDDRFADVLYSLERTADDHLDLEGLEPGRYVARAGAIDAQGEPGPWGAAVPFVIRQPPRVVAVSVRGKRDVEVAWEGAGDAAYVVELASDAAFTRVRRSQPAAGSPAVLERVTPGRYHVRVRAVAADGAPDQASAPQAVEVPVEWWNWLLLPLFLIGAL